MMIGIVGLGHMGLPMACRLAEAGYSVRGYDRDASARAGFEKESGVPAAASLAAAAAEARAVVLMLPTSPVVREVLLTEGLLAAMPPGSLIIDMGSSEPTQTRELAEAAGRSGVQLVDAPVSGGVVGARAGTLTVMVGGTDEQFGDCRPLLQVLGGKVLRAGPVGAGHALKALNNLLSATTLLISCEALLVGRRFGLDPQLMLEAINVSTGRSWSTEHKLPSFVVPGTFGDGFRLQLMVKDLRTAVALAEATATPIPLGEAAAALWERAASTLSEDADHTEIARWVEALSARPAEA
jgi:3-hydroxyisobutyrate dehydrogenase